MELNTLIIFGLMGFSAFELYLQESICDSVKSYIFSLLLIIVINSFLTGGALFLMFGSAVGVTAIVLIFASMGFPLFAGLRRIRAIAVRDDLKWDAQDFMNRGRNNAG